MFTIRPAQWVGIILVSFAAPVLACGQGAPCMPSEPGAKTTVRGYGYGYEGGNRPVTLVWIADGTTAGQGDIDPNGEFEIPVTTPMKPGLHRLLIRQGDGDASPVEITVPVVLPPPANSPFEWLKSRVAAASPWLLGALGLAAFAVLGTRGTRVQRGTRATG